MVNFKSLSLVFVGIIKLISSQTPTCMKYECDSTLLSKTCLRKANSTNTDLKTCSGRNYCKFDVDAGNCQATNYLSKQFIGGPCKVKSDCIIVSDATTDCKDNICVDSSVNCGKDADCAIGQFCNQSDATNKVCNAQIKAGETCTRTEECVNTAMCQSVSKKCVQYFSLEDGSAVVASERNLCKSGIVINGKCSSANLTTPGKCTSQCSYQLNDTQINSTDSCVCGKNENGDRFCNFGANSTEHVNAMSMMQEYFDNQHPCHTNERFIPCISQAFDKNSTTHFAFEYQKLFKNYHNDLMVNSVEFSGQSTSNCILPVLGMFDKNIIKPVSTRKCPMYTCKDGQDTCSRSNNPNNWDSSNITITLSRTCNSTQQCDAPALAEIQDQQSVSGSCLNINKNLNRFPGESCLNDADCKNSNCTSDKVCQHVALGGVCSSADPIDFTKQCGVGAYCNATNFCVEQIKRDQACVNTFDCQNNLVCFNKTCSMEYGSVKDNTTIDTDLISADFGENLGYLCETGFFDSNAKRCYSYSYANETSMTADEDGFVQCDVQDGKECSYATSIGTTLKKNCDCGFNANGQGYCPIDRNGNKKEKNLIFIFI